MDKDIISTKVDSSTIEQVDFDPLMNKVSVCFKNQTVYEYYDVDKALYEEFVAASSVGKFFSQNIKKKFEFAKRGSVLKESSQQTEFDFSSTSTKEDE